MAGDYTGTECALGCYCSRKIAHVQLEAGNAADGRRDHECKRHTVIRQQRDSSYARIRQRRYVAELREARAATQVEQFERARIRVQDDRTVAASRERRNRQRVSGTLDRSDVLAVLVHVLAM